MRLGNVNVHSIQIMELNMSATILIMVCLARRLMLRDGPDPVADGDDEEGMLAALPDGLGDGECGWWWWWRDDEGDGEGHEPVGEVAMAFTCKPPCALSFLVGESGE